MNPIYVIVESVSTKDDGEWNVEEVVCQKLGYFTDENLAEAKVNELNEANCEKISDHDWELMTEDEQEDAETRYGFIALELSPAEQTAGVTE